MQALSSSTDQSLYIATISQQQKSKCRKKCNLRIRIPLRPASGGTTRTTARIRNITSTKFDDPKLTRNVTYHLSQVASLAVAHEGGGTGVDQGAVSVVNRGVLEPRLWLVADHVVSSTCFRGERHRPVQGAHESSEDRGRDRHVCSGREWRGSDAMVYGLDFVIVDDMSVQLGVLVVGCWVEGGRRRSEWFKKWDRERERDVSLSK